ncbi:Ankyrin repeat-containing domain [Phytophthora cactorum]|nr:Ankyrin repeat-containing domain [Phytophthora cactorum]
MAAFKLKIVSLVLLHRTNSGASQHIEPIISSFLGPDSSLPLHKAARFNSKKLLNWIWKSSCASIEERSSGWSLTNFLRSDPHYYQWVFTKSLEEIISCGGDMRLVQWIYEHFPGCEVPKNVVETVARTGYLEFLQFLWDQQDKIKVDWSGEALKKAVEPDMRGFNVAWVFKDWYDAIKMACSDGHLDVVQWLVEHPNGQQAYLRQQSGQQILVWVAAGNGHVAVMEYIYEHWRTGNSPSIVIPLASSVAAIKG